MNEPGDAGTDWRPRPDPTLLTTQQLLRELASLREIIEARLDGMDKAIELIQRSADKVPTEVDTKLSALDARYVEKFASIQIQFSDRTKLYDQSTRDSKEAVAAALQAAKEAVTKSELNTKEQLGQLSSMIGAMNTTLNEKIDASTGRAETAVASLRAELLPQITGERTRGDIGMGRQMGQGALIAIIFGAISALGVIVGLLVIVMRSGG